MPKLDRKVFKPFASNANIDQIAQIGSLRAGSPTFSKDPDVIQAIQNYLDGWFSIAMGENSPAIEDMNALQYLFSYMIKSLYEEGIPSLNNSETYYLNSVLTYEGSPLVANRNDFMPTPVGGLGPLNPTDFSSLGCKVQIATTLNENALRYNDIILCNADAVVGDVMDMKVPLTSTVPLGKKFIIKNISTKGSNKKINVNCLDNIEGAASVVLSAEFMNESITIVNGGTAWFIV